MYVIKEIEKIIETIELKESEQLVVLEVGRYTDEIMGVLLKYTNIRCTHIYQLHINELPDGDYELYTYIKNERTGKNIDRTKNTAVITDKLIFAFANDIWETVNKNAYPDIFEIKRFVKFIHPQNLLCREISTNWLSKNNFLKSSWSI